MKPVLMIALSLAVLVGCNKEPQEQTENHSTSCCSDPNVAVKHETLHIQPTVGVGLVRLGMTKEALREALGNPDIDATGISWVYADKGMEVVLRNDQVHSIYCIRGIVDAPEVKACVLKTEEGIGIGSTEAEIVEAYGEPTKRSAYDLMYKERGLRFELDDQGVYKITVLSVW